MAWDVRPSWRGGGARSGAVAAVSAVGAGGMRGRGSLALSAKNPHGVLYGMLGLLVGPARS